MLSLWAGALLGVCQIDLWPLAWLALAPLALAAHAQRRRTGAVLGFAAGLVAGVSLYGLLPYGLLTYLTLTLYCGLHMAGFGLGIAALSGRVPRWAQPCLPALLWTGFEYLRRYGPVSFPITLSGSQPELLALAQVARFGGAQLCSFLIALPAGLVLCGWVRRRFPAVESAVVLLLLGAAGAWGQGQLQSPPLEGAALRVAGLQTSLPNWMYRLSPASAPLRKTIRDSVMELTRQTAGSEVDLLVWPETVIQEPLFSHRGLVKELTGLAETTRTTILAGTVRDGPLGRHNTVAAFEPGGAPVRFADKTRPAGYAERNVTAAESLQPLELALARLGVLICLESVYAQDARELVDKGADLLLVVTDDAGFKQSPMSEFHARRSRFRAIETGRYVIHLSQAGPSFVLDPYGRSGSVSPLFGRGVLRANVRLQKGITPYQRVGDLFSWLVWALLARLAFHTRRSRRRANRKKSQ